MEKIKAFPSQMKYVNPVQMFWDFISFRDQEIENSKIRRTTSDIELFLVTQFLAKKEQSCEKKVGTNPLVFSATLASMSPLYRRLFKIGSDLNVEIQPITKTRFHFLETFDPFTGVFCYPAIKENINWYSRKQVTPDLAEDVSHLLKFNFAIHHDLLHVIMCILVEPAKKEELKHYYLFMEALIFIQEFFLARDFGPHWSKIFSSFNTMYRTFNPKITAHEDAKTYFSGMLLSHLAALNGWNVARMKKELPAWAPYFEEAGKGFKKIFSEQVTNEWLEVVKNQKYPEKLKNWNTGSYQKLQLKSYRLENLIRQPELLDQVWNWVNPLLYDSKR